MRRHSDALTEREHEIVCLVARGLTDKEIATQLGLARSTVSNHVGVILLKLGVPNRAAAAAAVVNLEARPPPCNDTVDT